MTPPLPPSRDAARRERVTRRRRRTVATAAACLSAAAMLLAGAGILAGAGEDPSYAAEASPTPSASPRPTAAATTEPAAPAFCTDAVVEAATAGVADALAEAAGGAEALRAALVDGDASDCVDLADPTAQWALVNKQQSVDPIDDAPSVVAPATYSPVGGQLVPDAAGALDALAQGARDAGAGEIALSSGYRSYDDQATAYESQVDALGEEEADLTSARPGYSEHQLGLAADVVACDAAGCGTIYDFGGTAQGAWVQENAWRYGWITRYVGESTSETGYEPEPWHLRYVGTALAEAYVEGGYATWEDFLGAPAAADYE
ncbi:M15 family metallopeptidase [Microbacterium sp. ZXX196]|uniref:M15 family metallopeptidase n=1 Tax=Microbacterium sp. ZXX196 TaxID=2609291 RepID=UPI0012B9F411|nr:M15 family metallopeptidase [Microbacterium sp. ZXX196]MTE23970.1 D-alanyl-D-alanine carboxypeptidase family protein [Microbacterium sp. ZXX196]